MTKTCPDCQATVLSTSQPNRMGTTPDDPFNRRQVEAVCRAVCVVEGVDPDDDVYGDGCDPQWSRYADAVAAALGAVGGVPLNFQYQRTFDAICAAVNADKTPPFAIHVSVKAFQDAFNNHRDAAAQPASPAPAVDGERKALQRLVAECVNPGDGGPFDVGEWPALDAARAVLAQPASPLRGREAFDAWFNSHFLDPDGGSTHLPPWLKDDLRSAWDAASPPEQPAAVTEDELTKIMDEAWPDGHRAVARKIIERLRAMPSSLNKETP
jgi:hypothetical protein